MAERRPLAAIVASANEFHGADERAAARARMETLAAKAGLPDLARVRWVDTAPVADGVWAHKFVAVAS